MDGESSLSYVLSACCVCFRHGGWIAVVVDAELRKAMAVCWVGTTAACSGWQGFSALAAHPPAGAVLHALCAHPSASAPGHSYSSQASFICEEFLASGAPGPAQVPPEAVVRETTSHFCSYLIMAKKSYYN